MGMSGAITARSTKMEKWFTDLPRARIAMDTGTHSIWVSEQLRENTISVVFSASPATDFWWSVPYTLWTTCLGRTEQTCPIWTKKPETGTGGSIAAA